MIIVILGLVVMLLFVAAIRPVDCEFSDFELQRRCEEGDELALLAWKRKERYDDVITLRRLLEMMLLVGIIITLMISYDLLITVLIGFSVALFYPAIASLGIIRLLPQRIYYRYELATLDTAESLKGLTRLLKRRAVATEQVAKIGSKEELEQLIIESEGIFSEKTKKQLIAALSFEAKTVKQYMTPRSVMEAIGAHEMLGPLVLDGLHKTGHSHFPVFDGDLDHIVGTLRINNLQLLKQTDGQTVSDLMDPQVFYIHEAQTLEDAINICIKKRRHLLVVINDFKQTKGVITVEDAVEQMTGRKITGQFVEFDDIDAVAHKKPQPKD